MRDVALSAPNFQKWYRSDNGTDFTGKVKKEKKKKETPGNLQMLKKALISKACICLQGLLS